ALQPRQRGQIDDPVTPTATTVRGRDRLICLAQRAPSHQMGERAIVIHIAAGGATSARCLEPHIADDPLLTYMAAGIVIITPLFGVRTADGTMQGPREAP